MKLQIIFAPLLLSTMMDYTLTNAAKPVPLSLQQKQELFAYNSALLIIHIFESGYRCTLGEAFRTHEQAVIYMKEGLGIVHSKHCERLALDLNLFDSKGKYLTDFKDWEPIGMFWEHLYMHNVWGGRFVHRVDMDHIEME